MGEQRLIWTGQGVRFDAFATWGDAIPLGDAGAGASKPSDLLPISLAACTAYDVVVILRKQRQDLRGLEVHTQTTQEPDPPWRFTAIHMHFLISGDVDERKAARAIDLSESGYCAVAATLRDSVTLSHSFEIRRVSRDDERASEGNER
jgi:putative redox protein